MHDGNKLKHLFFSRILSYSLSLTLSLFLSLTSLLRSLGVAKRSEQLGLVDKLAGKTRLSPVSMTQAMFGCLIHNTF